MLRILHYVGRDAAGNNREYVVLTEEEGDDVIRKHDREGFKLENDIITDGDSSSLPTDHPLWPRM